MLIGVMVVVFVQKVKKHVIKIPNTNVLMGNFEETEKRFNIKNKNYIDSSFE
jgi:hypothetical protein